MKKIIKIIKNDKMKNLKIIACCFLLAMASCSKSEEVVAENPEDSNGDLSSIEIVTPEDYGNGVNENVVFGKLLTDGSNFNHIYQKTAGVNCGSSACLPASYMIARSIVNPSRAFSIQELNALSTSMGMVCGTGTGISRCQTYAKQDIGSCNKSLAGTTNRDVAKNYIRTNLESNFPIISLIKIRGGTSTANPDYLTTGSGFGHFVTIVGLDLTADGVGSRLFYLDPLDRSKIVREVNYTLFLNSCQAASSTNIFNLLAIGCTSTIPINTNYGVNNPTTLLLPNDNATNIAIPLLLDWDNATAGTIFRVHVSKTLVGWTAANGFADNSNRVVNVNTNTVSGYVYRDVISSGVTQACQSNTTYYWSVKSYVNGVSSPYSTPRVFRTR